MTKTTEEHLRIEAEGALRRLVLDRPPLNVLDIGLLRALDVAVGRLETDRGASVVLLTGEGKAFSAGVDVADHTADRVQEMIDTLHATLVRVASLEMPVIAAVNGAALGGGLELALACDIILAREGAKLGQPEIKLGVFPPFAAAVLPRRIGVSHTMDLCLTGRTILAEEARGMGIVQHVFPRDDFAADATAYAHELASLSPPVLRLAKRAIVGGMDAPVNEALHRAERIYLDELMELDDAREGLAAFLEKRTPRWKGA
ncbi:MAG: enoyl-CoA hydratase-related protein [Gemmatimonadota bacterium]|jgi:cyclohexa-1,5-dienecarbonyl-CoA hydratase